ncbi:choline transporter-like protein 2 [Sinocyclocheilus rhinocerous]|uniref:choline transporter-like protein 2 n=1 Tax=Sinocyclocheilus rhinocerous TaxID=307959 RepID=UPI0007B7DCB8|nr:PREDICTED: choline transporter-like protein 2 [Sinocyclocheilus rhinocerous]
MEPEEKNPESKYGEPRKFDPTFKGPIYNRGCTDILCCILFILALLGYFAVGILAWSQGDPRKVIYPTDSKGQFCGQVGSPLEKKPLLFYFNIMKCASPLVLLEFQCPTTQICVERCPDKFMTLLKALRNEDDREYYKQFCKEGVDMTKRAPEILKDGLCPSILTPSKNFTRRCLPALETLKGGVVVVGNETTFRDDYAGENINATDLLEASNFHDILLCPVPLCRHTVIILCIVEVVIILLLIFLRKRLLIAIALIKEASKAIGHVMSSLFYPLLTFALLSLVIAYWAITAVFLSTSSASSDKVFNTTECMYSRDTCKPETFNSSNIFKKPDDIPAYPVFNSLGRALRYHTGSLAFGSLILAIVQVIRVILEYLDQKLKGAQNKCAKFLLSCLKCCFWCLEKCIKFLNRNAYIMVAIYGKNFCTSAKDAFFLLMRNIVRVAVLDKVTDFLLFLGKLLVVGIVGICSFFFFTGKIKIVEDAAPSLNYYWVPILTVVFGAYLIAHGFFSVYAMCVDTLFLCFCEDLERNDGSSDKPFFMSAELHQILSIEKSAEETDRAEVPVIQVQAEEEVPLQENGEVQLKQQDILKLEQEEETPLNQETHIEEPPQETQPPEAPAADEEKPEEQVTTQEPEPPQVTPKQNGPQEVDAEDKEEQVAQPQAGPPQAENQQEQEPEEPKPQENGPQESETLLTPQE